MRRVGSAALAVLLAGAVGAAGVVGGGTAGAAPLGPVDRIAGADRYATAAAIATAAFPAGAPVVYVATGTAFADALTGAAAAAADGGPILLTNPSRLEASTARALTQLGPDRIVVLGGAAAVADTVVAELGAFAPVERVAGADRHATASAVSAQAFGPGVPLVLVATGTTFPDALAGAAAAAAIEIPVLLVTPGAVPAATGAELARLEPEGIVVLGGTAAVSAAVEAQLASVAPVQRTSGADRYETAANIATAAFGEATEALVATGESFPDALAGASLAGARQAPLLLTPRDSAAPTARAAAEELGVDALTALGGPGALSDQAAGLDTGQPADPGVPPVSIFPGAVAQGVENEDFGRVFSYDFDQNRIREVEDFYEATLPAEGFTVLQVVDEESESGDCFARTFEATRAGIDVDVLTTICFPELTGGVGFLDIIEFGPGGRALRPFGQPLRAPAR